MSYIYISQCPSYLMHSGVQGMHWGVRRYQNEDGSVGRLRKKGINPNDHDFENDSEYDKFMFKYL